MLNGVVKTQPNSGGHFNAFNLKRFFRLIEICAHRRQPICRANQAIISLKQRTELHIGLTRHLKRLDEVLRRRVPPFFCQARQ